LAAPWPASFRFPLRPPPNGPGRNARGPFRVLARRDPGAGRDEFSVPESRRFPAEGWYQRPCAVKYAPRRLFGRRGWRDAMSQGRTICLSALDDGVLLTHAGRRWPAARRSRPGTPALSHGAGSIFSTSDLWNWIARNRAPLCPAAVQSRIDTPGSLFWGWHEPVADRDDLCSKKSAVGRSKIGFRGHLASAKARYVPSSFASPALPTTTALPQQGRSGGVVPFLSLGPVDAQ
jgi:hypothetical protein